MTQIDFLDKPIDTRVYDNIKRDRTQHANVSEANFHPLILENNRIWENLDQNAIYNNRKHSKASQNSFFFTQINGPNELENKKWGESNFRTHLFYRVKERKREILS